MEQNLIEIKKLSAELAEVKKELTDFKKQLTETECARYFEDWIPRKKLMEFFDYGDTKIAAIFKQGGLVVSEIGNRKFVKKESVMKLLEKNVK